MAPVGSILRQMIRRLRRAWYFTPGENDVFLASFPRSGNTWLRAIFGALAVQRPIKSIEELDCIVPEDEVPVARWHLAPAPFHFIKTHASYVWGRRDFAEARGLIYVVRDPRDVVLSHYQYLRALHGYADELPAFIDDWLAGRIFPGSWLHHVRSWTDRGPTRHPRLVTVRYEDLRQNCEGEIGRLCGLLNLHYSQDQIRAAVEQATLVEMKKKETQGLRQVERRPGFSFINQGNVGRWQTALTPALLARIERDCCDGMTQFGYRRGIEEPTTGTPQ
jgi:hypothetical protein